MCKQKQRHNIWLNVQGFMRALFTIVNNLHSPDRLQTELGAFLSCVYSIDSFLTCTQLKWKWKIPVSPQEKFFIWEISLKGSAETLTSIFECGVSHKPLLHWEEIPWMCHLLTATPCPRNCQWLIKGLLLFVLSSNALVPLFNTYDNVLYIWWTEETFHATAAITFWKMKTEQETW